ncbi:hypothetical protein AA309_13180 [Microvirga vignae]|uniref:Uncharacterized protein n=1 Tax=Microvirga vignae TaxID=1225564 RepID=A0A0H1RCQ2_9HYPH|nr:hypothetical protein AA309_13180 [Microvirga vignae]
MPEKVVLDMDQFDGQDHLMAIGQRSSMCSRPYLGVAHPTVGVPLRRATLVAEKSHRIDLRNNQLGQLA